MHVTLCITALVYITHYLLEECGTLWGEHEQAMQYGIELLCS